MFNDFEYGFKNKDKINSYFFSLRVLQIFLAVIFYWATTVC